MVNFISSKSLFVPLTVSNCAISNSSRLNVFCFILLFIVLTLTHIYLVYFKLLFFDVVPGQEVFEHLISINVSDIFLLHLFNCRLTFLRCFKQCLCLKKQKNNHNEQVCWDFIQFCLHFFNN